jgi:hypothetical protein
MGHKKADTTVSFAEFSLLSSLEKNRSVKMMERISKSINWKNIETLLKKHYHIGQSHEGADAYSLLMLLKCILL